MCRHNRTRPPPRMRHLHTASALGRGSYTGRANVLRVCVPREARTASGACTLRVAVADGSGGGGGCGVVPARCALLGRSVAGAVDGLQAAGPTVDEGHKKGE